MMNNALSIKRIGDYYYMIRNKTLGEGSYGKVYLGFRKDYTKIAIKVIEHKTLEKNEKIMSDLEAEFSMKNIQHENIVRFYDIVVRISFNCYHLYFRKLRSTCT